LKANNHIKLPNIELITRVAMVYIANDTRIKTGILVNPSFTLPFFITLIMQAEDIALIISIRYEKNTKSPVRMDSDEKEKLKRLP